jgi:hypothetical protein
MQERAEVIGTLAGAGFISAWNMDDGRVEAVLAVAKTWQLAGISDTKAARGPLPAATTTDCGVRSVELAGVEPTGLIAAGATHDIQPRKVKATDVTDAHRAAAAVALAARGIKDNIDVSKAFTGDLDGDGKLEHILEAAHPRLFSGNFEEEKAGDYAVAVIVPGDGGPPEAIGFAKASKDADETLFFVNLEAAADLNGDGNLEVALFHRNHGLHAHFFRIYQYKAGKLAELGHFEWVERECE